MYKAPPPEVSSERFYDRPGPWIHARLFDPDRQPVPIGWAEHVLADRSSSSIRRVYARLQPLGGAGSPVRTPATARKPVTLADERRSVRHADRPVDYTHATTRRRLRLRQQANRDGKPREPKTFFLSTAMRTSWAAVGSAENSKSSVIDRRITESGTFQTCSSVMEARRRAAPTRRSRSWRWLQRLGQRLVAKRVTTGRALARRRERAADGHVPVVDRGDSLPQHPVHDAAGAQRDPRS